MIQHQPIEWWASKIKNNEFFSLARFGDGEILCMQGRKGGNSHGCAYTPELQVDLLECASNLRIYKGLQRVTPDDFKKMRPFIELGQWFNTEEFADRLAVGQAKPLFEALAKKKVILVSSKEKRAYKGFNFRHVIETPLTNTHEHKDRIVKEILDYNKPGVYLFACGMAAGPLVSALHGKIPASFFIDIGHLFDPFIGDNSREYLKEVPLEILNKNLP